MDPSTGWAGLPDLVLDLILQKLSSLSDSLYFSRVCKPWFSFVSHNNYGVIQQRISSGSIQQLPRLIILTDEGRSATYTHLYSRTKLKRTLIDFKSLPLRTWRCCGSSHGWLVFQHRVKRSGSNMRLCDPFSGDVIRLPCIKYYCPRVIISKNPFSGNFEAAALPRLDMCNDGIALAILKSNWDYVKCPGTGSICDMIYYGEKYYLVNTRGAVFSVDSATFKLEAEATPLPFEDCNGSEFYLVVCTNELLRVQISRPRDMQTISAKISKLVTSSATGKSSLVDVESLGDESLFLSRYSSMSVSASKLSGCEPNSVYYMKPCNRQERVDYCLDVIHLRDGSAVDTYFSFKSPSAFLTPLAAWIIPTPKFVTPSTGLCGSSV